MDDPEIIMDEYKASERYGRKGSTDDSQAEVMRIMCSQTPMSKALAVLMEVLIGRLDTKVSHSYEVHT
jgi:hypothetical protein